MKFGYVYAWVYFVANDCYYISSHRCSEFEYVRVDHSLCLVLGMMSPYLCGYLVIFRSLSKFKVTLTVSQGWLIHLISRKSVTTGQFSLHRTADECV